MGKVIGIDLGTSNSAAAFLEAGKPKIIPSSEGVTVYGKSFPSVVAFTNSKHMIVGEPARRQASANPDGTIIAAKRKMGTSHKFKISDKEYTPQQISAFLLQKIKKDAEEFLGEPVDKAVITVPAYFDDNQRQATKDAGSIAGLEVIRLVNEPTAAAFAYGVDKSGKDQKILVFDLGGGTLDVTVMEMSADNVFEVKSTSGDTKLGGTDMDSALIDFIIDDFKVKEGVDLSKDSVAIQRVREAAEKAKIELSTTVETDVNLPYITADASGPKHLTLKINRAKLESLVDPIVKRCKKPIEQALNDAGLDSGGVDKIVLVGGPTRMPVIQKFVKEVTGKSVERGVDPMECVAMGAAIQAGILSGDVKDVLLLDVTPLSLGIETLGGIFTKLINKNATIPTKQSQVFSTAEDNQPSVTIRVFQGERSMAVDNKLLGSFDLVGIPPAPRGVPQIDVAFDIDANGIVNVSAKDLGTGKEQSIKITSSQKLSDEELDKMKKDAEAHSEDDKKRREEVELLNQADTLIHTSDKTLKDFEGKIDSSKVDEIKKMIEEIKSLKEKKDISGLKSKIDEVNTKLQSLSAELYQQAASSAQKNNKNSKSGNSSDEEIKGSKSDDDKVFEADYKVNEDKKKK